MSFLFSGLAKAPGFNFAISSVVREKASGIKFDNFQFYPRIPKLKLQQPPGTGVGGRLHRHLWYAQHVGTALDLESYKSY